MNVLALVLACHGGGASEPPPLPPGATVASIAVSPSGRWTAVGITFEPSEVWVYEVDRRVHRVQLPDPVARPTALSVDDAGVVAVGVTEPSARQSGAVVYRARNGALDAACTHRASEPPGDAQVRGVAALLGDEAGAWVAMMEGGALRITWAGCGVVPLDGAAPRDNERRASWVASGDEATLFSEGVAPRAWATSGASRAPAAPPLRCPGMTVASTTCEVGLRMEPGSAQRCEGTRCVELVREHR